MRYIQIVVCAIILSFTSPTWSATPQPAGKNAAVGYLMAIGWMTPPSKLVLDQIDQADSLESLKRFASETWEYLSDRRTTIVIKFLKQGATCDHCQYIYERQYLPDDPVPPYRRLRDLAQISRAVGLKVLKEGNASEAFDIFRSVFRMGEDLEQDETFLSGQISVMIRKAVLNPFEELLSSTTDPVILGMVKEYLRTRPPSTDGYKKVLGYGRIYIASSLSFMKSHPERIKDLQIKPPSKDDQNKPVLSEKPLSKCQANQRVLQGALEMLCLDFDPMPASMTPAVIPEYLVRSGYLKTLPVCPEHGNYEVYKCSDGSLSFRCSLHPEPDYRALQKADDEKKKKEQVELEKFVGSPEFDALCKETLKVVDEAIAMDQTAPGFLTKLDALSRKIDASDNALMKKLIPDIKMIFEQRLHLDEGVQNLLKK